MTKKTNRVYSRYTHQALALMAKLIRATRLDRGITTQELADRVGISRGLLHRIEKADPCCAIGTVFEVAAVLGIALFHADDTTLMMHSKLIDDKLSLLPREARKRKPEVDDDF
jgi:transcriptional regulator with XRE-family HTH domain